MKSEEFKKRAYFAMQILVMTLICQAKQNIEENNTLPVVAELDFDEEPPLRPGFPVVAPNTPVVNESTWTTLTIDQIITPSDTCKEIVAKFANSISNFTHCSVTNSRPIHLCGWCIGDYLSVKKTYHDLFVTVDEKGNPCKEYFTNLDRIEIVADAYNYVHNLWTKGSCDYCFKHFPNGTIIAEVTEDVTDFILLYEITKSCFNGHMDKNNTCTECKPDYEQLNSVYIDMVAKYKDNVCLDLVDTMNTTREIWSEIYHCTPPRQPELWLHIAMGVVCCIPIVFYLLAYLLSSKQESRVLQQRRLRELFTTTSNSNSEASGYPYSVSPRPDRSTTVTSRSASNSLKTPSDPPTSQSQP